MYPWFDDEGPYADHSLKWEPDPFNTGALIIRIGFRGISYKETIRNLRFKA